MATAPLDFRFLDEGLGGAAGKKRKREEEQALQPQAMEVDASLQQEEQPQSKRQATGETPSYGKPTYDGVIAGKTSGRKWKEPAKKRSSALKVSHQRTSLEERQRLKRIAEAFKIRKHELKEQIRMHKVEKRKRMEEHKKLKEANTLRTGMKLQKITNPNKLKKMSKKQKKQLVTVAG